MGADIGGRCTRTALQGSTELTRCFAVCLRSVIWRCCCCVCSIRTIDELAVVFGCQCASVCGEATRDCERRRARSLPAAARAGDVDRSRTGLHSVAHFVEAVATTETKTCRSMVRQKAPERAIIASPLVNFVLRRASQSPLLANFLQWFDCRFYATLSVCVCVMLSSVIDASVGWQVSACRGGRSAVRTARRLRRNPAHLSLHPHGAGSRRVVVTALCRHL
jgi:hypothetical protein